MKNTSGLLMRLAIVVLTHAAALTSGASTILPFADTGATKEPAVHYLRLNEISANAARDFVERFPAVITEKWLRTTSGYAAKFAENNVISNVYYDRTGNYVNTVRYYNAPEIPVRLKNLLRSEYSDYTIIAATELITEKEKSFYFHVKNRERIKTLKVVLNSIETIADFRNANAE